MTGPIKTAIFICLAVVMYQRTTAQGTRMQAMPMRSVNAPAVFGGMGIDMVRSAPMVDYINAIAAYGQAVDDWGTAVDFFGGIEVPVGGNWGVKVEESYLFKSYSFTPQTGGTMELFYSVHAPSLLIQKVVSGEGYFMKIAAGGGYHFGNATEKVSTYGQSEDFTASGIGLKGEIVGETAFDENFFGYIGGQIGWELLGQLSNDSPSTSLMKTKHLRYFFAGLRFGVTYFL